MNWTSWIISGFIATLALSTLLATSHGMGFTRMNIPYMVGTVVTPDREKARPAHWTRARLVRAYDWHVDAPDFPSPHGDRAPRTNHPAPVRASGIHGFELRISNPGGGFPVTRSIRSDCRLALSCSLTRDRRACMRSEVSRTPRKSINHEEHEGPRRKLANIFLRVPSCP